MQYFNEFTDQMRQLFAKIQTKEEDAKAKIEQCNEEMNLKAVLAAQKKIMKQFPMQFSQINVNISEILLTQLAAVTDQKTQEENKYLKEMQDLHAVIESILKENIVKFNSLFDGGLKDFKAKKKAKKQEKKKAKILSSVVKSNHMVG